MTNARFDALFGGPPRRPEAPLDAARRWTSPRSIQAVTEEVVLRLTRAIAARDRRADTSASPAASR